MRTEKLKKDSIHEVYSKGLCTGCGTCAAACPTSAIEIIKNDRKGLYTPIVNDELCSGCGLCLKVCPGYSVDFKELNLNIFGKEAEDAWLGNYIGLYIGHATDYEIRCNSSSGGLITTLLLFALEEGIIDAALVTRMCELRPLEPEVIIARTREEIISASGSKYCPVPANIRLKNIFNDEGKFAVVGLPCHIHGIRKFEMMNNKLGSRINLRLGLMCSENATFLGTEYFLQSVGIRREEIKKLRYRGKGWLQDYNMVVTFKDGKERILPRSGIRFSSSFHYDFAVPRCLICCDQTCEFADLSFGDPRLADLRREEKAGKSLIVSRTTVGEEVLQKALSRGVIEISERISPERFFQAQSVDFKKGVAARLSLLGAFGKSTPYYNAAKLSQPNKLRSYVQFLFYLPSYLSSKRYVWPLLYPNAFVRACLWGFILRVASSILRLLRLRGKLNPK